MKIEGLKLHAFTRMDSPEVSRATAQRDEAASNERSVTRLPSSSARETKPCSSAACPSENPPLPATAGTDDEGGEAKEDEGGAGEASRRGERSRDGFFSSTRAETAAPPGTKAGTCGDI